MKRMCLVVSSVLTAKAFLLDQIKELSRIYDLRLVANTADDDDFGNLLATHPADKSRRARFANAAKGYATRPILTDTEWQALRTMCTVAPKR